MERTPILIVGGGPVGLAAALELARHGVRSLLLERHNSTTWHPKARNLNTRTMEIARGWGPRRSRRVDRGEPSSRLDEPDYLRAHAGR